MKKFVILVLISAYTINSFCQEKYSFSEVIKVDSVSKKELYDHAKKWLVKTFNNLSNVKTHTDDGRLTLIGKGSFIYSSAIYSGSAGTNGKINYTITITFKEGRYKYEFINFIHEGKSASFGLITNDAECPIPKKGAKRWSNKVWLDIKDQIEKHIPVIILSLKNDLSKKSIKSEDDW